MNKHEKAIEIEASIGYGEPLFSCSESFKPGIYGIIGPTGCGKSTFLKTLSKLIPPFDGRLDNPYESLLALQEPVLLEEISLLDNLYFALGFPGKGKRKEKETRERIDQILSLLDLKGLEKHRARELSGGQRQRLNLAMALLKDPAVYCLDEIFSFQEESRKKPLMDYLKEKFKAEKKFCFFTSHQHDQARYFCDELFEIREGKLIRLESAQINPEQDQDSLDKHPKTES